MYHGWLFAADGRCLERRSRTARSPRRATRKIRITAYPVRKSSAGWCSPTSGPQPAPLLPRWDVLVRDDLEKFVEIHPLPCNWLQCMDNTADPVHFEFLQRASATITQELGRPPGMNPAQHVKIEFDVFRYGIMKRRLLEGEPEDNDEWTIGHPLIFPNILAVGGEGRADAAIPRPGRRHAHDPVRLLHDRRASRALSRGRSR